MRNDIVKNYKSTFSETRLNSFISAASNAELTQVLDNSQFITLIECAYMRGDREREPVNDPYYTLETRKVIWFSSALQK